MDVSHLLDPLNEPQREAVSAPRGHVLVLAGAGSGKTRVLVYRLAWLIQVEHVSPLGLMAVTFTNKAATEMRHRVQDLLQTSTRGLWIGTFHGLAHRLLRSHYELAGLPQTFQIMDSEDQYRLLRRLIRDQGLDDNQWPARQAQWYINARKDEGLRPEHIEHGDNPVTATWVQLYQTYEQHCKKSGLVDFAELLLRAHELWLEQPALLGQYRQRFGHLLIDEFQDTNTIQYAWIRLLAGDAGAVTAVGDDDQSIYGWRGARVENVQFFQRDFQPRVIRLEQNYRSTGNILAAANAVITRNRDRLGKELWTAGEDGQPVRLYSAFNEQDEAEFVIARIRDWLDEDRLGSEAAILYRSNAQSRLFEQTLLREGIAYRVYGGLRFFERAEIKDAMGYLRLLHNRHDDAAFERVINTPNRGIGERSVAQLRAVAADTGVSLWQAARQTAASGSGNARLRGALQHFVDLVERLGEELNEAPPGDQVRRILATTDLPSHYDKEGPDRAETRRENLDELVRAAETYTLSYEDEQAGLTPLAGFLSQAALEAGEGQGEDWQDCVQLMTLHSAKGLEFPLVFIVGLEEGLFPHQRSVEESGRLEEERRLCYVGMTRAREQLYLCHAETRRLHGSESRCRPSRFIGEIPPEMLETVRPVHGISATGGGVPARPAEADTGGIQLGQSVQHPKFGEGVVLQIEGGGAHARVQVHFSDAGPKWLVLAYANLEPM